MRLWSAPAERSGDGALDWIFTSEMRIQSGVALRLPPHSKVLFFPRPALRALHSPEPLRTQTRTLSFSHARLVALCDFPHRRNLILVSPEPYRDPGEISGAARSR